MDETQNRRGIHLAKGRKGSPRETLKSALLPGEFTYGASFQAAADATRLYSFRQQLK